jgi:pSer/pThr/pTyr-binding forkhead associated (FHA) protein
MTANLVLITNGESDKVFPLPGNVTVLGRQRNCDLRIPLDSVSRRHCQFMIEGDQLKIQDLGSRNGTFLNGKQIKENQVKAGDLVKIGPLVFGLQVDGQPEQFAEKVDGKASAEDTAIEDIGGIGELDDGLEDLDDLDIDLDDSDAFSDLDLDDLNEP